MTPPVCARPGCTEPVLTWLDREHCSTKCKQAHRAAAGVSAPAWDAARDAATPAVLGALAARMLPAAEQAAAALAAYRDASPLTSEQIALGFDGSRSGAGTVVAQAGNGRLVELPGRAPAEPEPAAAGWLRRAIARVFR